MFEDPNATTPAADATPMGDAADTATTPTPAADVPAEEETPTTGGDDSTTTPPTAPDA